MAPKRVLLSSPVRERCRLVVQSSSTHQELRAIAERMLRQDEVLRQNAAMRLDAGAWSCTECKLLNMAEAAVCTACSHPNPQHRSWTCRHCTCTNPFDQPSCLACEQPSHVASIAKSKRQKQTKIDGGSRAVYPVWDEEAENDFQAPAVRQKKQRPPSSGLG